MAIGAAIPSERNEGRIDGYHCWAEFFADGKWWPVDISEGDKYSSLATYYFGHHPANRIELSQGRDLVVEPLPASGPDQSPGLSGVGSRGHARQGADRIQLPPPACGPEILNELCARRRWS